MGQISPLELQDQLNSEHPPHLLDVREEFEHDIVALPGACLIPLGQIAERYHEIESWKNQSIVVYCHHGIRSQHAIGFLSSVGFEQLTNLQSGIDGFAVNADPSLPRY